MFVAKHQNSCLAWLADCLAVHGFVLSLVVLSLLDLAWIGLVGLVSLLGLLGLPRLGSVRFGLVW